VAIAIVLLTFASNVLGDENNTATSSPATTTNNCNPDGTDTCTGEDDPAATNSPLTPSTNVGNPIDFLTGNKYQREVDLSIPASPLQWVRHYNSNRSAVNSGLGRGWTHSFDTVLKPISQDEVTVGFELVQSTGKVVRFDTSEPDADGNTVYRAQSSFDGYIVQPDPNDVGNHTWIVPDGRQLSFYGSYLVRIDYPGHQFLKFFYSNGRLSEISDETNRLIAITYAEPSDGLVEFDSDASKQPAAHIASVTMPDGSTVVYQYDTNKNLSSARFADGTSRIYHYEDDIYFNHLTGLTDRTGVRFATWRYDAAGRGVLSEHAGGAERVTITYPDMDAADRGELVTTYIENSLGQQSTYTWQVIAGLNRPQLISSAGAGCATCPTTGYSYNYDEYGRLTDAIKVSGNQSVGVDSQSYTYDELSRVIEIRRTDDAGVSRIVERREYESDDSLQAIRTYFPSVNPGGERVVEVVHDESGLPVSITQRGWSPIQGGYEAIERSQSLVYAEGRLVAIDGPREDVDDITEFEWDELKRLKEIRKPASPVISLNEIDSIGRVTRFRVGQQSPVEIEYNQLNRVVRVEQIGRVITFNYDAEGRLSGFTGPDGNTVLLIYSAAGYLSELIDKNGSKTTFTTDSEGRRVSSKEFGYSGELIRAVDLLFDSLGRLYNKQIGSLTSSGNLRSQSLEWRYTSNGRVGSITDTSNGNRVEVNYDVFGQLAEIKEPSNESTTFEHDAVGNEISLTDSRRNRTEYLKDDFGRVVSLTSPDTGITRYKYDLADNRIEKADADGVVIKYSWDAANRMVSKSRPDGNFTYIYSSENGKLIKSIAPSTTESFSYDIEARLVEHERVIDSKTFKTTYQYENNSRIANKILPDGQSLKYHYREDGTLRAITRAFAFGLGQETLVAEIDQSAMDGSSGHMASNGTRTVRNFAPDGSIRSLEVNEVMSLQYEFNGAGQIVGIDTNGTMQQYTYSPAGLRSFDTSDVSYRYEYDLVGNRTAKSIERADGSSEATRYTYTESGNGNKLMKSETLSSFEGSDHSEYAIKSYKYKSSGAPIFRDSLEYVYNSAKRPIRVLENGVVLAEYSYNGFGERIKKVSYSGNSKRVTYFLYDGNKLSAEINDDKDEIRHGVFLGESLVAYLIGNRTYAVHSDHLGTPRIVTDELGEPVWSADYLPFGGATISTSKIDLPYRLPGQYFDSETDTHYNYYRDYDPATGRYITSDPVGLKGGINTYAYALNNPLMLTDPLGLNPNGDTTTTGDSPEKPDPDSEKSYADKLEKLFKFSVQKLKDTNAEAEAIRFMEGMVANAAVIAGVVVAMVAANTAGIGVAVNAVLLAGGWLMAGYEAGKFLVSTISMALKLRNVEYCNDAELQRMGDEFADSLKNLGHAIAEGLLIGGIGRIAQAAKDYAKYAKDGAWALWRKLKKRFGEADVVAGLCSFSGDTLVVTRNGYLPIRDIKPGVDEVWARDEYTGNAGWRAVLAQYRNNYKETVHVSARNSNGRLQTIKSNRIHPYFAKIAAGALIVSSASMVGATEGHTYSGEIIGGAWVDAQHLKAGDLLLSDDNTWQQVESVVVESKPIVAYNLTVDEYSTFFVAADVGIDAVWVHNSCADKLPDGYTWTGDFTNFDQPKFKDADGNIWYRGHDGRYYDLDDHPPSKNGVDGPTREPTVYQTQFDNISDINNPTNQKFGEPGNGTTLGANMEAVGFTRPPNSDAHHIIAGNDARTAEARRARDLFEESGIDVNAAVNGVYLPRNRHFPDEVAPNHKRVHTKAYYQAIIDRLEDLDPSERGAEIQKIGWELANNLFRW